MNNWIIKYIKFFTTFITVTTGLLWGYYHFTESKAEQILALYTPTNIRNTCEESILDNKYQICFRKNLPTLFEFASPFDLLKISEMIDDIKDRELYQSTKKKNQIRVLKDYYTNRSIFNDYISSYQLSRNHIDFFQIILLPYIKRKYKEENLKTALQYKEDLKKYPELENNSEVQRAMVNILTTINK